MLQQTYKVTFPFMVLSSLVMLVLTSCQVRRDGKAPERTTHVRTQYDRRLPSDVQADLSKIWKGIRLAEVERLLPSITNSIVAVEHGFRSYHFTLRTNCDVNLLFANPHGSRKLDDWVLHSDPIVTVYSSEIQVPR